MAHHPRHWLTVGSLLLVVLSSSSPGAPSRSRRIFAVPSRDSGASATTRHRLGHAIQQGDRPDGGRLPVLRRDSQPLDQDHIDAVTQALMNSPLTDASGAPVSDLEIA